MIISLKVTEVDKWYKYVHKMYIMVRSKIMNIIPR